MAIWRAFVIAFPAVREKEEAVSGAAVVG